MFSEYSEKSGDYSGVGPHTVAEYYIPGSDDCAGVIEMRIAGFDGTTTVAGKFIAHFKRVSGTVTVGGFDSLLALAAPLGCLFAIDQSSGVIRGRFTGILGFDGSVASRCDVWVGP